MLLNWGSKVMKSDEGFSNNVDKQMLIQLVNENVIPNLLKQKFKKGSFYCPFFLFILKSLVMKSDEGFSNMLDKTILIQYQYENVTSLN